MEILRIENIKKTFGTGDNAVQALDGISLSINRGDFLAIVGPSGSGKSTLLHILGGLDTPTSGRVFIDGRDIYRQSDDELAIFRRREVGIIYQFYNLIPVLNVEENISLPLLLDGRRLSEEYLNDILLSLGLSDRGKHYPDQLSGGQQQRVSIGRALINRPALLLADEPTGNLDSKNSQEIVELFKKFNRKQKQTIILITHDENIALQADRLIALEDGRIVVDEVMRR